MLAGCDVERAYLKKAQKATFLLQPRGVEPSHKSGQRVPHGTGFFLKHNGKVKLISAAHVCWAEMDYLLEGYTMLDERFAVYVKHTMDTKDLCVLDIAQPSSYEPSEVFVLADRAPKLADKVFALGFGGYSPLTVLQALVLGNQDITVVFAPQTYTIISKPIIPGMSGGPVVNSTGQVVGINQITSPQSGIGGIAEFNDLKNFLESLP